MEKISGAFARIIINYKGTLEQLAVVLAEALGLKPFVVETGEDPPHGEVAYAEALGWELWLKIASGSPSQNFSLRIETEHSFDEIIEGRMYDLSPWFSRLVTTLCEVDASPEVLSSPQ
jgi:hypothetical protein